MCRRGVFVSFEGGEGTGKSTQVLAFEKYLNAKNIETMLLREPGGVPVAEAIRDLILFKEMEPLTELFLYVAARAELFNCKLRPALAAGRVVIADRGSDSTVAYQGYARGLTISVVKTVIDIATNGLEPDVTYLLDVDPEIGLQRSKQVETNKFEVEEIGFHLKVRNGFLELAKDNPERVVIIDATPSVAEVYQSIIDDYKKRFL